MTLQEGIGWSRDARPGAFFGLLCLRRSPSASPARLEQVLTGLWQTYGKLRGGTVGELPPEPRYAGRLQCLVAYGPRLFQDADREGVGDMMAAELRECAFGPAVPGGPVLPGVALRYADDVIDNGADADVAIQLTADTQLALTRAAMATHRYLSAPEMADVALSGAWLGYRREDRRSWLGFHDGVDNVIGLDRFNAVVVGPGAPDEWLRGGTYLAFLRIEIDLDLWESLSDREQEVLVGRKKATGAPLDAVGGNVEASRLASGTKTVLSPANLSVREPPLIDLADPTGLGGSHVQRTRRHPNVRIYRQGYEFLDIVGSPPVLRAGLNFVSFQSAPLRIVSMLRTQSWLGGQSFAGAQRHGQLLGTPELLVVRAAGLFAAPPAAAGNGLPGQPVLSTLGGTPEREGRADR